MQLQSHWPCAHANWVPIAESGNTIVVPKVLFLPLSKNGSKILAALLLTG